MTLTVLSHRLVVSLPAGTGAVHARDQKTLVKRVHPSPLSLVHILSLVHTDNLSSFLVLSDDDIYGSLGYPIAIASLNRPFSRYTFISARSHFCLRPSHREESFPCCFQISTTLAHLPRYDPSILFRSPGIR
jgi:hypothetical protein